MIQKKKEEILIELIIYEDPELPINEGIRIIRTNLKFSIIDENVK